LKYPVYSAFVSALLVSPLFLAVGCDASAGDECSVEGDKFCSGARDEILICSRSAKDEPLLLTTDMKCTDGTICEDGAEGPECVLEGGTGGSGGYGGSGGLGGTGGSGGTGGGEPPTIDYVKWTWPTNCVQFQPSTVTLEVGASDDDTNSGDLTYSGSVDGCTPDISMATQTLSCDNFSLTFGSVTVRDPQGNTDMLTFEWESICQDGCEPGEGGCP